MVQIPADPCSEYKIDSSSSAHIEQLEKYTDDDINLMAYLQTLR
jgi:hypothetical protein